ncbi:ECF transporter S component [Calorimonas adulescens]|uniref:ECF transporter S component n=1 Tax=Calorimonas adulescens TaxID=2606906 RepID=A0A5D8QDX5_9THEO|nr:ECF transporter S component [Calorimonas adulescens]TZE82587.1 ECF transporter S component [Calorimonas adulescens]
MKTHELTAGAVLTALAIMIPIAFGGILGVVIPPFSATLTAHVPEMLAMLVSPSAAVMVGLGSAFGFLLKLGPVVAARALTHAVWGAAGAMLIRRGMSFNKAVFVVLPVHAILEGLIVIPFGIGTYMAGVVVIGTVLHHTVDALISMALVYALMPVIKKGASKDIY